MATVQRITGRIFAQRILMVFVVVAGGFLSNGTAVADNNLGKKYALIVGVGEYQSSHFNKLKYSENDAEALADVLAKNGYSVRILTTGKGKTDPFLNPTAKNIIDAATEIVKGKNRNDLVMVAMSGHGAQFVVNDPKSKNPSKMYPYFCPTDATGTPTISYETGDTDHHVSINQVISLLNGSDAGTRLLIMDACRNEMQAAAKSMEEEQVPLKPKVATFFSCKSGERSYESSVLNHGIFFHFLLSGLNGKAANAAGNITWNKLVEYTYNEVNSNASRIIGDNAVQQPRHSAYELGDITLISSFISLVNVMPSKYLMGSPEDENDRSDDETVGIVEIKKSFKIGATEITQSQFETIMGYNPSAFSKNGRRKDTTAFYNEFSTPAFNANDVGQDSSNLPVENVSWEEANEFCQKLTVAKAPRGFVFRLPTEIEWEYACRGGPGLNRSPFSHGQSITATDANFEGSHPNGNGKPVRVGSYQPNSLGLFDMHGNVAEWCLDQYTAISEESRLLAGLKNDNAFKVLRGGSWASLGMNCRSASRGKEKGSSRNSMIGFRVVLVASDE